MAYVDFDLMQEQLEIALEEASKLGLSVSKVISYEVDMSRVKVLFDVDKIEYENNAHKHKFRSSKFGSTTFYNYTRTDFVLEFVVIDYGI